MRNKIALLIVLFIGNHSYTNTTTYHKEVQEMITLLRDTAKTTILPNFGKVTAEQADRKTKHHFKDLVTSVDKGVSQFILDRVRSRFPGSYSEEHKYADRFDHDLIWQLDPVDGTQEFCEGYAEGYTSLAALLKKQNNGSFLPVAGIIYRPALDHVWYNDGSDKVVFLKNGIEQPLPNYTRNEIVCYQRKVDYFNHLEIHLEAISNKLNLSYKIVESGGAGASIADLLEGKINLIIFNNNTTKDWDIAMAVPMIKALNGFICDLDGNDFNSYNRKDSDDLDEPYNLRGYVISLSFNRDEIVPNLPKGAFDDLLHRP